jgi:hypothetical protein
LTAIGDFFAKPDPQTTNPFKSLANGAIAVATDSKNGAINLGNAIKQFSQDPIGTVKYGAIAIPTNITNEKAYRRSPTLLLQLIEKRSRTGENGNLNLCAKRSVAPFTSISGEPLIIAIAPFIIPSTQIGKDATSITFTGDRGQIITLGNAARPSIQTLANLFNNNNSVVPRTKPNGYVSLWIVAWIIIKRVLHR